VSYIDAIVLGIVQGLTEFLPVSSSGHLVLAQKLLGVKQAGVTFEVLVHLGSLVAVLIYFRAKIWLLIKSLFVSEHYAYRKVVLFLIVGTIPAVIVGFSLRDFFEQSFSSPVLASSMLIVTGAILLSTRFVRKSSRNVNLAAAIIMGIGQAISILPGISRSGTTIASGMLWGVDPSEAAEFSFLLSIPAIAGAVVLNSKKLLALDPHLAGQYLVGTLSAFIFALLAVYTVLAVVRRGKFEYFAYYCFAAGLLGLYLFL
jgi:undecaprenyl-diphosphatase